MSRSDVTRDRCQGRATTANNNKGSNYYKFLSNSLADTVSVLLTNYWIVKCKQKQVVPDA